MSTRDQWGDRLTFIRREQTGIDPTTQRPTFDKSTLLEDEPCDLVLITRRVATQTNAGTVYNTVTEPVCKIFPPQGLSHVPDENDVVTINGRKYRVGESTHSWDGGSRSYRGSQLHLHAVVQSDETVSR